MEDVTVGFLMQIDKLVYLLESPIFVHLRLKLLDVESPSHAPLLKSIYGILLCLPQGDAFRLLNNRLTTVCNLRDNLGLNPMPDMVTTDAAAPSESLPSNIVAAGRFPMSLEALLTRFDDVFEMHRVAQENYDDYIHQEQQRLQIHVLSGNSQQAVMSASGQGGRGGSQQYGDRRGWE
jgi:vacuole morphology and inheritance protein 14